MKKSPPQPKPEPLNEGLDYYLENGNWVFTEHFLRKRGNCCGSGCGHCPYRKKPLKAENLKGLRIFAAGFEFPAFFFDASFLFPI